MTTNPKSHLTFSIFHIKFESKQIKGSTKTWLNETNVNEFTEEKKGIGGVYLVGGIREEIHGQKLQISWILERGCRGGQERAAAAALCWGRGEG